MAAYAALVFIVSVIPVAPEFSAHHLDKLAHLCEYLLFAWLLAHAMTVDLPAPGRIALLWVWLWATSYGLFIELVQAILPWRSAELGDAVSNALGAALGTWVGGVMAARGRRRGARR